MTPEQKFIEALVRKNSYIPNEGFKYTNPTSTNAHTKEPWPLSERDVFVRRIFSKFVGKAFKTRLVQQVGEYEQKTDSFFTYWFVLKIAYANSMSYGGKIKFYCLDHTKTYQEISYSPMDLMDVEWEEIDQEEYSQICRPFMLAAHP